LEVAALQKAVNRLLWIRMRQEPGVDGGVVGLRSAISASSFRNQSRCVREP